MNEIWVKYIQIITETRLKSKVFSLERLDILESIKKFVWWRFQRLYGEVSEIIWRVNLPGDPKKSIPLFGVSGGIQVFAKELNRHTFGFPTKNLTIWTNTFKDVIVRKKIFETRLRSKVFSLGRLWV